MDAYINKVADYLFTQSWQIAILAIIIGLVSFALRNRSAHIRYLLWLILLAKCLIPPVYSVPVAVLPQESINEYSMPTALPARAVEDSVFTSSVDTITVDEVPKSSQIKPAAPSAKEIIVFIWLAGTILFLLWILIRAVRYTLLIHSRRTPLGSNLYKAFEGLFADFRIKKAPRIWLIKNTAQPFVWGLFRGSVYLPADFLDSDNWKQNRIFLAHELSHVARFDAAINVLQIIIQAIYWFHPFVWWANKTIRQEREKCCDEMTVVYLSTPPENYTNAIVEALAVERISAHPIPSMAIVGSVKDIEERIKTMLRPGKKFYKRPSVIAIVVLLFVAVFTIPIGCSLIQRSGTETATEQEEKHYDSLFEAAQAGDLDEVERFITAGTDPNVLEPVYDTPRGRQVTPLAIAAEQGHFVIVKVLLDSGTDVDLGDSDGWSPLFHAVFNGHKDIAELLIGHGANVNVRSEADEAPLFYAVIHSNKDLVNLLISNGADVNLTIEGNNTPLHWGISNLAQDFDIVKLLVDNGAKFDLKDSIGYTPLRYAAYYGRRDIIEYFISKGADASDFYISAFIGDLVQLKELIEQGTDVDAKDEVGWTALFWAACGGQTDVAEFLVTEGADVNVQIVNSIAQQLRRPTDPAQNFIPLHQAATIGELSLVELLVSKGSNVNAIASTGYTPLSLAASGGHLQVVEYLISQEADVNGNSQIIRTAPLYSAISGEHIDVVKFLLEKGANANLSVGRGGRGAGLRSGINARGGRTLLDFAQQRGNTEIIELLREYGAEETPQTLQEAASSGDIDAVKLLISQGADVNARDQSLWQAPLHQACQSGNEEIVKLLINNGANVNAKVRLGMTPLHIATMSGQKEIIELLITQGADVNLRNNAGRTPLDLAEQTGNTEIVELLRQHGVEESSSVDEGDTVVSPEVEASTDQEGMHYETLFEAAQAGDLAEVERLIAEGADVNNKDSMGRTPLHIAASALGRIFGNSNYRDKDIVEFLIDHGADINLKDQTNYTPLNYAIFNYSSLNKKDIVKLLVSKGADVNHTPEQEDTPLHYAVEARDFEIVKLLVDNGAKFDVEGTDGYTALQRAVSYGYKEIVELFVSKEADISDFHLAAFKGDLDLIRDFIEKGTDVDTKDEAGWTALFWAASAGQTDVAEFLVDNGANISANDGEGQSLLHLAAQTDDVRLLELLISNGISVDVKDKQENTPLHVTNNKDVAELLISNGANVNAQGQMDKTPLHVAVSGGNREMVEFLIDNGADINAKARLGIGSAGSTPLHFAVRSSNWKKDIIELLITNGADVNLSDNAGRTPFDLAIQRDDAEMIKLLREHGAVDGAQSLLVAVTNSDIEEVKLLISQGADINALDILHSACQSGNREMVQLLIDKGADVNTKNWIGRTPLHLVAIDGYKDIVELLIDKGADMNSRTSSGQTPLDLAIENNQIEIVELLREYGAEESSSAEDDALVSPEGEASTDQEEEHYESLIEAAQAGDLAEVERLIAEGADINSKNELGQTALYIASSYDRRKIVQVLVEKGADVNIIPETSYSVFNYAIAMQDLDLIKLMVDHGAKLDFKYENGWTDLHYAVYVNSSRIIIEYIISKIVDTSSLHVAAFTGDLSHVEDLIDQGTEVDTKDDVGWTALFWACSAGQKDLAEFLINSGANVNVKTVPPPRLLGRSGSREWELSADTGLTPLHQAATIGETNLIELLVSEGADIDAYDHFERTPLFHAVSGGHLQAVEMLINKGADINGNTQTTPITPLYTAVSGGHIDIVKFLLDKGADPNISLGMGRRAVGASRTLLDIAEQRGNVEIIELLREYGAEE